MLVLLSILYLAFSVGHYFLSFPLVLLITVCSTSLILILIRIFFKHFVKSNLRTYILVFSIFLLVILNSNLHIYITHDIKQSIYIIFIVLSCGFFLFSRSSYWCLTSITVISWYLIIHTQEFDSSNKIHYAYSILTSIILAYLILIFRLKSYSKIQFIYLKNKSKNESLKKALKSVQSSHKILRREKNRALKASQLKSQFVANMSHELRTPLNAVIGLADMMLGTKISREQGRYVKLLQNAGETLLCLINDILDFSKIEANEVNIDESKFNLDLLLNEIKESFKVQINLKKIDLKIEVPATVRKNLIGDSHRLKQILNNLISNAIKFTEEGEVALKIEERYPFKQESKIIKARSASLVCLRFNVSDTGPGVPTERQETIFEQYIQSDNTISKRFGGAGLGLAICKKLVENMKGNIGLFSPLHKDSERPGSLFWFELPLRAVRSEQQRSVKSLKKYKAIIVDNLFPKPVEFFGSLKDMGLKIKLFDDRDLDSVKRSLDQNSILFLHAGLKEINSFKYISMIREEYLHIPMVVYSTVRMRGDTEKARLSGTDLYLNLPIETKVLKRHLQDVIGKYHEKTISVTRKTHKKELGRKARVLVAEDNEVNQLLIKTILEKKGARVSLVSNGKDALKNAVSKKYDLIFMDISMPEMDGYQVSASLRKKKIKTPIIALTAHAFHETQERCSLSGMNGFISKPYRDEDITRVFERWI